MTKKHAEQAQTEEVSEQTVEQIDPGAQPKNDLHIRYKHELDDLTDTLKRLQAEFENYKKRTEKENKDLIKNSNANLIIDLLPVLDSFELAIKDNGEENPETAKMRKGIQLIYSQLFSILESKGLRIIDTKDKRFDPYKHDVLLVQEGPEDGIILQELQNGYMLNDIVIRHSKVMISKKGHIEEKKQEENDGK